jgi:signal transduction histidine kinase
VTKAPSIAFRLAVYLLATQILGAVLTTLTVELFVEGDSGLFFNKNRDGLAPPRMHLLIWQSLRQGPDGALVIEPSGDLLEEMRRTPGLRVAAFDPKSKAPLPGSSPDLVDKLAVLRRFTSSHMHFKLDDEADDSQTGHLALDTTPHGPLLLASYGHRFRFEDLFHTLQYEFMSFLRYFTLEAVISVGVGYFAFKRSLRPLNKVAREAEGIDLDSLHQRLSMEKVPAEATALVTSINNALARLDASAERQRRFLANAAHELRTPVAILMERLDDPAESSLLPKLRRDAERIRNIVEQLLATVRLDRRVACAQETIDLSEITQSIVDDHALIAVKTGRQVAFESTETCSLICGDRLAVQSILANLIHNALRAEPEGGAVIVRVLAGRRVEVVDHGDGIAESDRDKIFEPFWRKSDRTPGTGLGLAIAKELMEKLGGRIEVERTPGGGATFLLTFASADVSTHSDSSES